MDRIQADDPTWQNAWRWVTREHDAELGPAERAERAAWLLAEVSHRQAYEEAQRIHSMAGLMRTLRAEQAGDEPPQAPPAP